MNPLLFLAQARRLVVSANEEDWRTAASRAYYAAFHVARTFMTNLGFTVPHAERAHAYLWMRLQNAGDAGVVRTGGRLNNLRRLRTEADYELGRRLIQARAQSGVQDAALVIQILDAVVEPTRTQVMNAMKDYERLVLQDVTWHP